MAILLVALPVAAQEPSKIVDLGVRPDMVRPAVGSSAVNLGIRPKAVRGKTLYGWSVAALIAGNAADAASSWRGNEANPVVAGGGAQFGAGSVAIKAGLVGTALVIQHVALRHRPDMYRKLAWVNFAAGGVFGGVAARNYHVASR